MMSGASAAILRQSIRPRGGGAVISSLSINTGVSANCQFRSVCNTFQLFSSSSTSPIQLSSTSVPLPPHGPRTAASLLLGSSHYSPTFIGSTNRAGLTSFDNLQLRPNNGIRLHRWFSDKSSSTATTTNSSNDSEGGSSQHNTWVQFQRSIAVSGFETGQTTKERTLGKKNRGGKMDRKRKEREAEADSLLRGEDVTQLKGGEFPALRYSDEETERLLAEAYAAIPPRGGKRGTLNLKRQKRRHFIKRQYHIKKKFERIAAHERRMAKRKRIYDQIKKYSAEAGDVRARDEEYQNRVLQRWAEMNGHSKEMVVSK